MSKKHILTIGLYDFAFDNLATPTAILKALEKGIPCEWKHEPNGKSYYHASPLEKLRGGRLEMNKVFKELPKPKPVKVLALPKPNRGSILCICEKSYVSPKQSCPHCGRSFSESHNRTHDSKPSGPNLRLL